ncbi:MAG: HAMP domain-containing histidine kinase [Deltaproteobacteria bacterium]|nr:HAMP domain-containing histidine kinase [Deltaproteobacteria bacterium]
MMKRLYVPILIFVVLQVAWSLFLSLWIVWYVRNELKIAALARQLGLENVGRSWLILVGGSILLLMILLGITFLFVYLAREARFNRRQGDFISSITHELKSPLASIQLYLETLNLREPPPEDTREFIQLMLMDTERLSLLVDNILVTSRIRRRKLVLDPVPVDVFHFIQDFLDHAMIRHGWNREVITVNGEPGQFIMMDRQYMEVILTNIVTNAIKYSNKKFSLLIDIKAEQERINITFTDKGIGVESKELKKIFKIFYRSRAIRKSGVQGTGLGLYIVRDVVKALGGKVKAASPGLGEGLTITLSLPKAIQSGK